MDDSEPPSKRRKVEAIASDLESSKTPTVTNTGAPSSSDTSPSEEKSLSSFSVEIPVGRETKSSSSSSSGSTTPPSCAKRKQHKPKERTLENINLRILRYMNPQEQEKQLSTWFDILNRKKKIIVIAGAGISVSAGIPDFRSATGLFASVKNEYGLKASGKQLFDASVYKDDKSTASFHDMVRNLHSMSNDAQPSPFHHLLASLAASGRLLRLYTQNVDGIETGLSPLETKTPLNPKGPWPKTVQLHGGLDKMTCSKCRSIKDFDPSLFNGPKPPDCIDCVGWEAARGASGKRSQGIGKLRPRIVLYNEHNPDEEAIGAVSTADLKARPDCLIVVGTSLKIPGVQRLVREWCASIRDFRGGKTVWINRDEPPATGQMKGLFDLILRGDCDTLAKVANIKHHDQFTPDCDLKKITGTGMEFGVSTPVSMESDTGSPLSSPLSYASSTEDLWENVGPPTSAGIPWPPPKVVIPVRPLSPSASPHPKKAVVSKVKTEKIKKTKLVSSAIKTKTKVVAKKKVATNKSAAQKRTSNKQAAQSGAITKVFKASKKATDAKKTKKTATTATNPTPAPSISTPTKPVLKVQAKPLRVSMETLKRKAELELKTEVKTEVKIVESSPASKSELVFHGSDSSTLSFFDESPPISPSALDPNRGMRITDLLL